MEEVMRRMSNDVQTYRLTVRFDDSPRETENGAKLRMT